MNKPVASSINRAEQIVRTLTVAILRGEYAVGSRLPTVRALALQFNVNPATIQRSRSRLEATGLVVARQGSGTEVRDPVLAGDLSLVPAWLEALCEQPARAAQVLGEFLEVRRLVVLRLVLGSVGIPLQR
jgi:DNA-binding GntR family transcriptional regulator